MRNFWNKLRSLRFHYAAFGFVLLWCVLIGRAFQVQVIDGPFYKAKARAQQSKMEVV